VPGNACINVSLSLTDDGLKAVSWKVDADVHVMEGYARGTVLEGMHGMSELYVGELLKYQVELSDELMEYLGGNESGCGLGFIHSDDGASGAGLSIEGVSIEGNLLTAEILCEAPASGELYLYSPDGETLGCLERNVVVGIPKIVVSDCAAQVADEPVESLAYLPEIEVNGSSVHMYVYFTDAQGYNLNGIGSYGFDSSLFDLRDGGAYAGGVRLKSVMASYAMLPDDPGSASALMRVSCRNDGLSHAENLLSSTKAIITLMTRILSARASRNLPRSVIRLYLRAIFPSAISVREAAMNTIAATIIPLLLIKLFHPSGCHPKMFIGSMKRTVTGTRMILIKDNLLGKFI
jgi:hypothetical protein